MKTEVFKRVTGGQVIVKGLQSFEGMDVQITIQKKGKRSSQQNRYMHMMFSMIQKGFVEIGYREVRDMETAKEIMKRMFLSETIDNGTGGKIQIVKKTSSLTKSEMAEFIDQCIQFAAENLNTVIPSPGEQTNLFDNNKAA